jgi:transposase InsO family protein
MGKAKHGRCRRGTRPAVGSVGRPGINLRNEQRRFINREQAKREVTEYIEVFYNRIRKQARFGYLSPAAFSQKSHAEKLAT